MTDGTRLDAQHPWPGLAAYDELARAYFHGRDAEIDALARRIEQTPLVVLFGKSGLGKTSLLRAGLLPRLRERRFLPVYVRLAFQPGAPALMDQVREALRDALAAERVDAPPPAADEPLWRYLHRSGLEFWSADNHLLTPLLVLDQFEEVFTLGAADTAAVARFAVELGDLAENRIPQGVQTAEGLHTRAMPYKLLLSLREDFLPELETWRAAIPGLGRARMRLRALGRTQALEAVLGSGGHLMSASLARRIVDFVAAAQAEDQAGDDPARTVAQRAPYPEPGAPAGAATSTTAQADAPPAADRAAAAGGDLDAAFGPTSEARLARRLEIEPALLSLFCRGLNEQRLRAGKARFDDALLDAAKQGILTDYYRSCFEGMPESVARWVATELITEKGYRNSVARDDATPAHLTESELGTLIDRRLLRLEERYGTQRIELTHDLLTRAVREARDRLREDDARAAAEQHAAVERAALEGRLAEERAAERRAAREQALQAEAAAGRRFKRLAIGLAAALVCAAGAIVWAIRQTQAAIQAAAVEKHFKEVAIEQSRLAQEQRQLAEKRLQSISDGISMKQAVLAGDRERIRAYLERSHERREAEAGSVAAAVPTAPLPLPAAPATPGRPAAPGAGPERPTPPKATAAEALRPTFGARAQPAGYRNPQGQAIYFYSLMPTGAWRERALDRVAVITYRMDHPTFQNALLATGRESGFTARYTGWGCLTNVVVLIEYVDPARPIEITEFDMCAALP